MTEHTPGPWEVAKAYSMRDGKKVDEEWFVRRPEDDVAIASDILDPGGPPYFNDVAQVNAHLIAASPLLLAECEWMFSVIGGALDAEVSLPYLSKERYEQTRTVLADARGEK